MCQKQPISIPAYGGHTQRPLNLARWNLIGNGKLCNRMVPEKALAYMCVNLCMVASWKAWRNQFPSVDARRWLSTIFIQDSFHYLFVKGVLWTTQIQMLGLKVASLCIASTSRMGKTHQWVMAQIESLVWLRKPIQTNHDNFSCALPLSVK